MNNPSLNIELIYKEGNSLCIGGFLANYSPKPALMFIVNGKEHPQDIVNRDESAIISRYEGITNATGFFLRLPLKELTEIEAYIDGHTPVSITMHRNAHMDNTRRAYRVVGDLLLFRNGTNKLCLAHRTRRAVFLREILYWSSLIRQIGGKTLMRRINEVNKRPSDLKKVSRLVLLAASPIGSVITNIAIILFRSIYFIINLWIKKKIWLISDRIDMAGDNGEAFLKYAIKQRNKNIKIFFVISKKSNDYKRIKKITKHVVSPTSFQYKFLLVLSDKVISSQASDIVLNAFGSRSMNVTDLYTYDFVFLQHGITKDDLSSWLNKYNRDIRMFVTAARAEYKSILEGAYYYDSRIVRLTGLPRYDQLRSSPKSKLILAPTWRENLVSTLGRASDRSDAFANSDYFKFYNNFMNNNELLSIMKEASIVGELYLHPSFAAYSECFLQNDVFKIKQPPYSYQKAFSEGAILVTDFSSVAFDFAYLKKPLVYTQFDKDIFFDNHSYKKGYFSYEKDGFGPVAITQAQAVNQIAAIISTACKMSSSYQKRVEGFFGFTDRQNSARVYADIVSLNARLDNL